MFGRKVSEYVPASCAWCGCLIGRGKERRVTLADDLSSTTLALTRWEYSSDNTYCGRCKPPYDRVLGGRYFRRVPEHFIEVTEDGEEIKPHKATTK